ncbi:MAG: DUF2807 domain-containing protein, partial [Bacteroidota bacterium]
MKRSNLILLGALGAILLFSTAFQLTVNRYAHVIENRPKTDTWNSTTRNVDAFTEVSTDSDITLVYKTGTVSALEIKTNVLFVDSIITKVEQGTLKIDVLKALKRKDSVAIIITNPALLGITLGGECHFMGKDTLAGKHLRLEMKEKSSANIMLNYESVEYTNTSSGVVDIKGTLNQINI